MIHANDPILHHLYVLELCNRIQKSFWEWNHTFITLKLVNLDCKTVQFSFIYHSLFLFITSILKHDILIHNSFLGDQCLFGAGPMSSKKCNSVTNGKPNIKSVGLGELTWFPQWSWSWHYIWRSFIFILLPDYYLISLNVFVQVNPFQYFSSAAIFNHNSIKVQSLKF